MLIYENNENELIQRLEISLNQKGRFFIGDLVDLLKNVGYSLQNSRLFYEESWNAGNFVFFNYEGKKDDYLINPMDLPNNLVNNICYTWFGLSFL